VQEENAHPFDDQPIRINWPRASSVLTRCSSGGREFSASTAAMDVLYGGQASEELEGSCLDTPNTRGDGCT
jgi:hydroxymethylpyrimidine/phosphomethylpyrimidine kinase